MCKISILIPVYNTEKYLRHCLESILNQTSQDFEVIAVNDGSTDNSLKILEEYELKDNRIKVINIENQGVSNARNKGMELAKGEFIMFIDSDDWMDVNTCEKIYEAATINKADSVLFAYVSEASTGQLVKYLFNSEIKIFNAEDIYKELYCGVLGLVDEKLKKPKALDVLVSVWGKLYKREIILDNNIQFVDLNLVPSECQLFNFEYYRHASRAVYIGEALYHYRRFNSSSVTKRYRNGLFEKWLYWIEYVKNYLEENTETNMLYDGYYSRICFSIIPLSGNLLKRKDFLNSYNELKKILNHESYIEAYSKLNYTYFPIHWYLYFKFAKMKFVLGVYLMSKVMRMIIDSRKK